MARYHDRSSMPAIWSARRVTSPLWLGAYWSSVRRSIPPSVSRARRNGNSDSIWGGSSPARVEDQPPECAVRAIAPRAGAPVASQGMSDRTLVLLKPDAVERGLVGAIVGRFEAKGLRIVALDQRTLDKELLGRHYEEHVGKAFYDDLVTFMSRGPVVAMCVEGPQDTWEVVRGLMGATNPRQAAPGTIRGDLGIEVTENLVHGSDSAASAERELGIFFPDL